MTLLDAYALIAFLVGGPATPQVRAILREGDAAVATANLVEVLDVSQRVHGMPIPRAVEILDPLLEGPTVDGGPSRLRRGAARPRSARGTITAPLGRSRSPMPS